MSFNKIIIVGNLGRDPELRYTPQGHAVCSFTMATNEYKKDAAGERSDIVTWFKVTLWRQQAENAAKYLIKGSPVYIEGRLRIETYVDRENNNRYVLDVQASDMQFISAGERSDSAGSAKADDFPTHSGAPAPDPVTPEPASTPAAAPQTVSKPLYDDDIPF